MYKSNYLLITALLFMLSCENDGKYIQVKVNDSIRIDSQFLEGKRENIIFAWSPPNGPRGSNPIYSIHDDHMYFTPDIKGKYHIRLISESMNNEKLGEENFFYMAIAVLSEPKELLIDDKEDTAITTNIEISVDEEEQNIEVPVAIEESIPIGIYTIQFSAKESKKDAEKDKIMLRNKGFTNITIIPHGKYHRVRLNGFKTIGDANLISKKIKEKMGVKVWIIENK